MTRGPNLQKIWDELPPDRKQRIEEHAAALKAEYCTLQALRQKAGLTQARVSEGMHMPQSNVSRLEKSPDMLMSTLRSYVEAIGGKLKLTVELPDGTPINLSGLGDLMEETKGRDLGLK